MRPACGRLPRPISQLGQSTRREKPNAIERVTTVAGVLNLCPHHTRANSKVEHLCCTGNGESKGKNDLRIAVARRKLAIRAFASYASVTEVL